MLSPGELDELKAFRQMLHQHPELSGEEEKTAGRIVEQLRLLPSCKVLENIGGHGVVAVFKRKKTGPTVLVRTDMDALPIQEKTDLPYSSAIPQVAHLCGHDGHTTMGLGLARLLDRQPLEKGNVYILFQPSEENGKGARRVLHDPVFRTLKIDKAIALHNLPGFPRHEIIVRDGPFACASAGLDIRLEGKTSHAAEPEKGNSPVDAIAHLLEFLAPLRQPDEPFRLATVVHVTMGDESFGINPGSGRILVTLRAETDELLRSFISEIHKAVLNQARAFRLTAHLAEVEPFAATVNEDGFSDRLEDIAGALSLSFRSLSHPFRWSEDAGELIKMYGGGLFGLGAGMEVSALHNPDYDFPDEITQTGVAVFYEFIKRIVYEANIHHRA